MINNNPSEDNLILSKQEKLYNYTSFYVKGAISIAKKYHTKSIL
jgi:hypothetical protein